MNWFKAWWWAAFISITLKGFGVPPFEAVPWSVLGIVVWVLGIIALIKFFAITRLEEIYE